MHEALTVTTCDRERLYFIPLTVIMKFGKERNGSDRWLTTLQRALMWMSFFLKVVRKEGHCHKLPLRPQGAGSPHQCPAAGEGHFCCANTISGWHQP